MVYANTILDMSYPTKLLLNTHIPVHCSLLTNIVYNLKQYIIISFHHCLLLHYQLMTQSLLTYFYSLFTRYSVFSSFDHLPITTVNQLLNTTFNPCLPLSIIISPFSAHHLVYTINTHSKATTFTFYSTPTPLLATRYLRHYNPSPPPSYSPPIIATYTNTPSIYISYLIPKPTVLTSNRHEKLCNIARFGN